MWFRSLIQSWPIRSSNSSRSANQSRHPTHRINLEPLEDRRMLSFNQATSYPTGPGPRTIDAGDFDGDGMADLVTANQIGSLGVLLNNGDGTFGSSGGGSQDNQAGLDVLVGDLNADGKLDLFVSTIATKIIGTYTGPYGGNYPIYGQEGQFRVMLGNGDGSFTPGADQVLGDKFFVRGALGDLDNDGDLDAAFSTSNTAALSVLLGNGDGTFGAPQGWEVGSSPAEVDIADFNGDGNLDLVTTNFGGSFKLLLGNGDGSFQPAQTVLHGEQHVQSQAVGDVNGDGKLDLATTAYDSIDSSDPYGGFATYSGVKVVVLLGHGDGTFAAGNGYLVDETQAIQSVELADVDGDGKLDVAVGSYVSGAVTVLHGNGDGSFSDPRHFTSTDWNGGPLDLAVADLNGDSALDIAAANYGAFTLSVLLNDNGVTPPPTPPSMTIGDATVTEGHTGTRAATFTVTLSAASPGPTTVNYSTANDKAAANGDYQSASGSLTFALGETTKVITVLVNGDRGAESDETFSVNLSGASGATIVDGQGLGTIVNDDPWISVSDVTRQEGQSGNTAFVFTVSLSQFTDAAVTVNYATANGTATAGSDFQAASGALTFASSQTSKTVTVQVKGDRVSEANETFFVNLSAPSGGAIADAQGLGTITNDDSPRISIGDVTMREGNSGATQFVFTVSLSSAAESRVTVDYGTANGSARKNDDDYVAKSGKLTFSPGQTSKTVTVTVLGDRKNEGDESFFLNLGNAKGAEIDDGQALGTILNDDAARRADRWLAHSWADIEDALDDFLSVRNRKGRR